MAPVTHAQGESLIKILCSFFQLKNLGFFANKHISNVEELIYIKILLCSEYEI